jgi:hypothetical protein
MVKYYGRAFAAGTINFGNKKVVFMNCMAQNQSVLELKDCIEIEFIISPTL